MTLDSFWDFAKPPSTKPPVYRDTDNCYNYNRTFDVCTIKGLLERLPEMLEEDVCLHRTFVESVEIALVDSITRNWSNGDYDGVQGTDFVHVVYDGDEPQKVVYHGKDINMQLVEADHKRYNLEGNKH